MDGTYSPRKKTGLYKIQSAVASTSLMALGVTFELVSKYSSEMQSELKDWEEGRVVLLGVLPNGPAMSVKKEDGQIKFLGMGMRDADFKVLFKNMDSGLMVLTGQMGSHTAFSQFRAIVYGNLTVGMQVSRTLAIVQKYLLPAFMLNKTFKRPPVYSAKDLWIKAKVMALIGPGLIAGIGRKV